MDPEEWDWGRNVTNFCTHVIQHFESRNQSVLSRKKDGMVIAVRAAQTVAWGEDPRSQAQRVFTDPQFAMAFLRSLADVDLRQQTERPDAVARIEEFEGESKLVSPSLFKGLVTH